MKKVISVLLVFILFLSACSSSGEETSDDTVSIATTVYPVYQLAYMLTDGIGTDVDVFSVYPANTEIHGYELSAQDIKDVVDSDLYLYVSDDLESFSADIEEEDSNFVNITQDDVFKSQLDPSYYEDNGEGDIINEHIWIAPSTLMALNDSIKEQLCTLLPDDCLVIGSNYSDISEELSIINDEYTAYGEEYNKTVVTSHDAFYYLQAEYGIQTLGIYGEHHDDEPSSSDVANTIERINKEEINTIYEEQNGHTDVLEQIADETGTSIGTLNTLATEDESYYDDLDGLYNILNENLEQLKQV